MKPLLAEKVDLDHLSFPYLASPKYDGFRCVVLPDAGPCTRSLKPVPNVYVRGKLAEMGLTHLDGELLTYTGGKVDDFNVVQSKLSSRQGMPDFRFMVFDHFGAPNLPFMARQTYANDVVEAVGDSTRVQLVPQTPVKDLDELLAQEEDALAAGWEGLMLRSLDGRYKFGRSTAREGILLKVKRTEDDEGVVVGFEERRSNQNEATTSALGYTERSSHRANMVPCGDLGALTLEWRGVTFDVGTGFTAEDRRRYWGQRDDLRGRLVTFGYQGVGSNKRPRFPRFKGFRSREDVG